MKNRISYFMIFISLLFAFSLVVSLPKKVMANENYNIESKSAYLIDVDSGTVLFKKDENKHLPIASMCKVMTLLIAFDKISNNELFIDENVVISKNSSGMGGSQVFLEEDGEYSVDQLLKSIVVCSANDACVAIAERIACSEDAFVKLMNEKCKILGMDNTVFVNCTGLPKEGQYSCSKDVATMFSNLIKHDLYFKYSNIWMDKIIHPGDRITEISNTNKLVKYYNGCVGGKTGYTSEAGHCLTAFAKRNNTNLVSVIIGAPDSKTRFKESSDLFDFGFNNFYNKKVVDKSIQLEYDIDIDCAKNEAKLLAQEDVSFLMNKGDKQNFEVKFKPFENLKAPLYKNSVVGVLEIYKNDQLLKKVNVVLANEVQKKSFFDNIKNCIDNWSIVS